MSEAGPIDTSRLDPNIYIGHHLENAMFGLKSDGTWGMLDHSNGFWTFNLDTISAVVPAGA